jgi:hypothetical protein
MVRLTALLMALRSWKVRLGLALALVAVLVVVGIVIDPFADDKATNASVEAIEGNTAPPTTDWKAQEEKEELNKFLKEYGSGYDCPANNNVTRIDDLIFCPDYTAILTFQSDKVYIDLPEAPAPTNGEYIQPIVVSAEHLKSCGNDGVKGATYTCEWYWHVKWEVNPHYVPLGFTEKMTYIIGGIDSPWYGPVGMGWPTGDMIVYSDTTDLLHIHAGDPKPSTPNNQTTDDSSSTV